MEIILAHAFLNKMGGGEKILLDIAKHFNAPIYTYLYSPNTTLPEFEEVEVIAKHVCDKKESFFDISLSGLEFLTKQLEGYDIINAHGIPSHWLANLNDNVVWYCHGVSKMAYTKGVLGSSVYRFIDKYIVRKKIKAAICNSNLTCREFYKVYQREGKVLNPYVDVKEFRNREYGDYFLYIGRINPIKKIENVIMAFREARKEGLKDYKLVIAGALEDKDYLRELKKMAGEETTFFLNPTREEIIDLYSRCFAFINPSPNETFGMVILEAMASEKAVISLNKGGPTEIILNEKTGYLVRDHKEMAEKMFFLAKNPDVAKMLGKNGRKVAISKFSKDKFFEKLEKLFKKYSATRG